MPLPDCESRCCAEVLKKRQLGRVGVGDEAFAGGFGYGGLAGGVEFGFFEVFEDFLGAGDDRVGEAGEAGDLDAVALVCTAGEDFS